MYVPQPTFTPAQGLRTSPKVAVRSSFTELRHQQAEQKQRIIDELKTAGASRAGLLYSEVNLLPKVLHDDEHIVAVVHGHHEGGFAMLIATNSRVIFLDKKPLFIKSDELSYDIVGGVNHNKSAFLAAVTLHTRIGDYTIKTFNFKAADNFRRIIEERCLEHRLSYTAGEYEFYPGRA